jgi:hypothetical protein|tara:strand:+ start:5350 stop:5616 length:267 start_codon:yes stop_codon:yes gene_type:complete
MFTFDREIVTIIAVIVCIVATAYMYKELKKTNEEMEGVKGFNGKLVSFLSRPKPSPFTEPESEKGNALQTQVEEKSLENQDSEEDSSE